MDGLSPILAQAGGAAQPAGPYQSIMQTLMLFLPLILIMYFLIIRPQQKQRKAHAAMLEALKPGDRVVTSGGLIGVLTRTEGTSYRLKIAPSVEVNVLKSAVAGKTEEETP